MFPVSLTKLLEQASDPWANSPGVPWDELIAELKRLAGLQESITDKRVSVLAQKYSITPEQVREYAAFDPTPNGQCVDWILRQIKAGTLRLPEDDAVTDQLARYTELKRKSTFTGEKDLNRLTPGDLWTLVNDNAETRGKKEKVRLAIDQGIEELGTSGSYGLYKVTTPEAGATLWNGTNWCVKDPKYFNQYGPPFFYLVRNGEPYVLYHPGGGDLRITNDKEATLVHVYPAIKLYQEAGLLMDPRKALSLLMKGDKVIEQLKVNRVMILLSLLLSATPVEVAAHLEELGYSFSSNQSGEIVPFELTQASIDGMGAEAWMNSFETMVKRDPNASSSSVMDVYDSFDLIKKDPYMVDRLRRFVTVGLAGNVYQPSWIMNYLFTTEEKREREPDVEAALKDWAEKFPKGRPRALSTMANYAKYRHISDYEDLDNLIASTAPDAINWQANRYNSPLAGLVRYFVSKGTSERWPALEALLIASIQGCEYPDTETAQNYVRQVGEAPEITAALEAGWVKHRKKKENTSDQEESVNSLIRQLRRARWDT